MTPAAKLRRAQANRRAHAARAVALEASTGVAGDARGDARSAVVRARVADPAALRRSARDHRRAVRERELRRPRLRGARLELGGHAGPRRPLRPHRAARAAGAHAMHVRCTCGCDGS